KATHEPFHYPERLSTLLEGVEIPEPESLLDFYPDKTSRTFEGQILEILGARFANNSPRYMHDTFSVEGLDADAARRAIYQEFAKTFLRSGAAIDENLGRILDYLDEEGLRDNTVVIYTSDQGYFIGEHGLFDKRMMYEESIRMPFVISYPPEIDPNSVNDDLILNTDFAPLFLDYAGLSIPPSMQGRSFRANLQGLTPDDWRDAFYYRYWTHETHRPAHLGIRTKDEKLMFLYGIDLRDASNPSTSPSWEYYDLAEDPKEINNLYNEPTKAERIQKLKSKLSELKVEAQDNESAYPATDSLFRAAFTVED
ncbi:MAG: sulfatase/phosphatase domain-containing protein, partial [Bacteroidota bacterium]